MSIVKKLSVKIVSGEVGRISTRKFCGRFGGQAIAVKTGLTNFGEWTALEGRFRAISPDGEQFDAPVCFLPDVAMDYIRPSVQKGSQVDFLIDVFAEPDSTVAVGYRYSFDPVLPPAENDPVESLFNSVEKALPALPAPKVEEKKTTRK